MASRFVYLVFGPQYKFDDEYTQQHGQNRVGCFSSKDKANAVALEYNTVLAANLIRSAWHSHELWTSTRDELNALVDDEDNIDVAAAVDVLREAGIDVFEVQQFEVDA